MQYSLSEQLRHGALFLESKQPQISIEPPGRDRRCWNPSRTGCLCLNCAAMKDTQSPLVLGLRVSELLSRPSLRAMHIWPWQIWASFNH